MEQNLADFSEKMMTGYKYEQIVATFYVIFGEERRHFRRGFFISLSNFRQLLIAGLTGLTNEFANGKKVAICWQNFSRRIAERFTWNVILNFPFGELFNL